MSHSITPCSINLTIRIYLPFYGIENILNAYFRFLLFHVSLQLLLWKKLLEEYFDYFSYYFGFLPYPRSVEYIIRNNCNHCWALGSQRWNMKQETWYFVLLGMYHFFFTPKGSSWPILYLQLHVVILIGHLL